MINTVWFVILHYFQVLSTRPRWTSRALCLPLIGFPLAALIVFGVVAALAEHRRTYLTVPVLTGAPFSAPMSGQQTSQRIEAELITLTPDGFEPAEIKRSQGRFLLALDNRSGVREITLRLDREAGNRLCRRSCKNA